MVGTERQASLVLLRVARVTQCPEGTPYQRREAPKRQEETAPGGAAQPALCSGPLGLHPYVPGSLSVTCSCFCKNASPLATSQPRKAK